MRYGRGMRLSIAACVLVVSAACGDDGSSSGAGGAGAAPTSGGGGSAQGGALETGGASQGGGDAGGEAPSGGGGAGGEASQGGAGGAGGAEPDFYGALSGSCGVLDAEDVSSPAPQLIESLLDFTGRPTFDVALLTPGGQEMFADGNLGGSSLYSEIFAFEVLNRCDSAVYLKSEAEIVYAIDGKKTDLLIELDGSKVGVSVVRAMSFPEGSPYPVAQAYTVLEGKLADILESSANVAPEDAWEKQFLSVLAQTPEHAAAIVEAYAMIPADTKADTVVVLTVTEGEDDFIYYNN